MKANERLGQRRDVLRSSVYQFVQKRGNGLHRIPVGAPEALLGDVLHEVLLRQGPIRGLLFIYVPLEDPEPELNGAGLRWVRAHPTLCADALLGVANASKKRSLGLA